MASKVAAKRPLPAQAVVGGVSSSSPSSSSSSSVPTIPVAGAAALDDANKEARLSDPPTATGPQLVKKTGRYQAPRVEEKTASVPPVSGASAMLVEPSSALNPSSSSLPVDAAAVPSPTFVPATSSVAGPSDKDEVMVMEDVNSDEKVDGTVPDASHDPDLPALVSFDSRRVKSLHVGTEKLLVEAGIDSRSRNRFKFDLEVDARFADFKGLDPAVFSQRSSTSSLARYHAAVGLLGDDKGLSITLPSVPQFLVGLMSEEASDAAATTLNPGQLVWFDELRRQARVNGFLVLDAQGSAKQRWDAATQLLDHLAAGVKKPIGKESTAPMAGEAHHQ